jgi:hypothetical protein
MSSSSSPNEKPVSTALEPCLERFTPLLEDKRCQDSTSVLLGLGETRGTPRFADWQFSECVPANVLFDTLMRRQSRWNLRTPFSTKKYSSCQDKLVCVSWRPYYHIPTKSRWLAFRKTSLSSHRTNNYIGFMPPHLSAVA